MLVYLFRQRRTDDLALTTDVTGRNILVPHAFHGMDFRGGPDIDKFEPRLDIADFEGVLRRVKAFGYYLFEANG